MQFLVLRVVAGPESGKKITVRSGQRIRVGRSPRADFCLAKDGSLADFHFLLDCTRGNCEFQIAEGSPAGALGGVELISETLFDGDQFQVGSSGFSIQIEGQTLGRPDAQHQAESSQTNASAEPAAPPPSGFAKVELATAELVLEKIPDPPDEMLAVHEEGQTSRELFEKLVASGSLVQALQFLTFALPKQEAVWALVTAIEKLSSETLPPSEQAGLAAARQWVLDPSEENRRIAETRANVLKRKTPAGFAVQAAFWSEGSMAPAGETEVPVLEPLCHTMVNAGTMKLAGRQDDFDTTMEQLLQHWTAVADGELSWE